MKKPFSMAVSGLAGLIGVFSIACSVNAAETETPLAKATLADTASKGIPKIHFETNFFDFGTITAGETLAGVFKFKNIGDGPLKVAPPEPSCDCTDSKVKPDTVAPGESGEIVYTIKLGSALKAQRYINVRSNDPKTPVVRLTMQMDYTPLYKLSPKNLTMILPAGKDELQKSVRITRTDGKPLDIDRLTTSQKWIAAAFDPSTKPGEKSAQINVTIHRPPGPPDLFTATIQMWSSNETVLPMQTLGLSGEILGEVAPNPPRFYWVLPDLGKDKSKYPEEALTKKVELVSILGHEVELKGASSNIKGLRVQIVRKEPKKRFELILKFDELPEGFVKGKVMVDTTLASLPRVEVPITVSVPWSN